MTRIGILGIGGVGGFLGAKLAIKYAASDDVEIVFIARGENQKAIQQKGLRLITAKGEETAHPDVVTNDPAEIGELDFLICCVKSYHLEDALAPLKPCVNGNTIILPLLNGVDARERIEGIFPENEVWDGCVYIMARLIEPGVVSELGNIHQYHFGSTSGSRRKLETLERIFTDAGVDTFLSKDIEQTIWDKFLLISTIATLTSALDFSIQEIFADRNHQNSLLKLMEELVAVGEAKGVRFSDGVVEKTLKILKSTPAGGTSSMHSDFVRGGSTEYKSLTEYVVNQGKRLGVPTPNYESSLSVLASKTKAASSV